MNRRPAFHLFQRFGVELEYMIVHAESLAVLPVTDRVLWAVAGQYLSEIELGTISWSNELALHVIELKTTEPAASLDGLAAEFQEHVGRINRILEPLGGRLMPTAMHPWMDPHREMRLVAARAQPRLRSVPPRLRLPRARLGQPAERPSEPAVCR
jgi:glutamate---cysteine ligase / carboxylate-amine ligase